LGVDYLQFRSLEVGNMKAEYIEGPKARENFERLGRALFQAPKTVTKKRAKRQPAKATARKARGKNMG
jgi:hypothetical protein